MEGKRLIEDDIIKSLESCSKGECKGCYYEKYADSVGFGYCLLKRLGEAVDIIHSLQFKAQSQITAKEILAMFDDRNYITEKELKNAIAERYGVKNLKEKGEMKIKLDKGAFMPTRAHKTDAGLDLYAGEKKVIPAKGSAVFDTGVHIELPKGTVGMLKSKSGLNVKHGLTSEGVIDVGYTGSICVKLYNNSDKDYTVNKGDKISQLVIMPIVTPTLELVEDLTETERGNGGFGSTGR